ncbi:MAG: hypothetical protein WA485_11410 [Candidatus Sulfotelmatobacter sp.]
MSSERPEFTPFTPEEAQQIRQELAELDEGLDDLMFVLVDSRIRMMRRLEKELGVRDPDLEKHDEFPNLAKLALLRTIRKEITERAPAAAAFVKWWIGENG